MHRPEAPHQLPTMKPADRTSPLKLDLATNYCSNSHPDFIWLEQLPLQSSPVDSHLVMVNVGRDDSDTDRVYVDLPLSSKSRRSRFTARLLDSPPSWKSNSSRDSLSMKSYSSIMPGQRSVPQPPASKLQRHRPLRSILAVFLCCVFSSRPPGDDRRRRNKR